MRDIGQRIQRQRLSRYAPHEGPLRRHRRWLWLALAAWAAWAGYFSNHSVYQLMRLRHEQGAALRDLEAMRLEADRLEAELADPEALRELAERVLREQNGMARPGEIVYRIKGEADTTERE